MIEFHGYGRDDNDVIDPTMEGSSVTISGDFSFASACVVGSRSQPTTGLQCDERLADQRKTDDEIMLDELEVLPNAVLTAQYLCIEVPTGEMAMAIPETEPYMVTTEYTAGTTDGGVAAKRWRALVGPDHTRWYHRAHPLT